MSGAPYTKEITRTVCDFFCFVLSKKETINSIEFCVVDKLASIPLFAKIKVSDKLSMNSLTDPGFKHDKYISGTPECDQAFDWAHTIISNAKTFILSTYHGLDQSHSQAYLDEYCYRLNRRDWVAQLFPRLLNACASSSTFTWAELTG